MGHFFRLVDLYYYTSKKIKGDNGIMYNEIKNYQNVSPNDIMGTAHWTTSEVTQESIDAIINAGAFSKYAKELAEKDKNSLGIQNEEGTKVFHLHGKVGLRGSGLKKQPKD